MRYRSKGERSDVQKSTTLEFQEMLNVQKHYVEHYNYEVINYSH